MTDSVRFARCQECGNTETYNTELSFCDGAGDALRRHPRTRMVEVDQAAILEQFGATEDATEEQRTQAAKDAETALGLEAGTLAGASVDTDTDPQPGSVFREDEGKPTDQ